MGNGNWELGIGNWELGIGFLMPYLMNFELLRLLFFLFSPAPEAPETPLLLCS
jgi:hypothetical protein